MNFYDYEQHLKTVTDNVTEPTQVKEAIKYFESILKSLPESGNSLVIDSYLYFYKVVKELKERL